ncbi:MAG: O-antigen ligase family protein [Chloroflexi bacterium]|jgi:O-antigen ligase|nr:O-antigen ligase family protein [Anaerolineaceae bacterium]NLI44884.1 O-antigen ligase family protein [Chloroflexota bacterium]
MTIEILQTVVIAIIGFILAVWIITYPFLGIVLVAASLPITDLLPSVPFLTSILPVFGGLSMLGYLLQNRKKRGKGLKGARTIIVLGVLFIFWIYITHPQAAWFGSDRNWMLTYLQLVVLAFLAEELLDDPKKMRTFIWVFSFAAVISAIVAIQQGHIGEDIDTSVRTGGLSEGANSAGRYFVIGMIFFVYLRTTENLPFLKILSSLGIIITFIGVFYTVSRTAMVLLFTAIGLIILLNPRKKLNFPLIILFMISILAVTFLSDTVFRILGSIIPSISQGTDTIGLRYRLWEAGFRMWQDHPITGVGIGRYPNELPFYGRDIPSFYLHLVAHSTYIQLLSETGVVGLGIWLGAVITSVINLWKSSRTSDPDENALARVWFIVMVILLIGAITMTQSAEKFIWICMGVSEYFHLRALNRSTAEKPIIVQRGGTARAEQSHLISSRQ